MWCKYLWVMGRRKWWKGQNSRLGILILILGVAIGSCLVISLLLYINNPSLSSSSINKGTHFNFNFKHNYWLKLWIFISLFYLGHEQRWKYKDNGSNNFERESASTQKNSQQNKHNPDFLAVSWYNWIEYFIYSVSNKTMFIKKI